MEKFFLERTDSILLIIDVQEKLSKVMKVKDDVVKNCLHLIELAKTYNIPILVTEQYPKGLGQTLEEIRDALPSYNPIEKLSFNCCEEPLFLERIKDVNKKNVIIVGMETHICILQTCIGLLKMGLNIHIVKDAVCSRFKENWKTGIELMRDAGAVITCTETILFQVLKIAGTEEFRAISRRIK